MMGYGYKDTQLARYFLVKTRIRSRGYELRITNYQPDVVSRKGTNWLLPCKTKHAIL